MKTWKRISSWAVGGILVAAIAWAANTPYMNLALPVPGVTAGPQYATMINTAFDTIDAHNHTPGNGAYVPTAGLNINADLSFFGFSPMDVYSVQFTGSDGGVSDGGVPAPQSLTVRDASGDLWYIDALGNQIRLTCGGQLCVASDGGTISNMTGGASADYYDDTFFWSSSGYSPGVTRGYAASQDFGAATMHYTGSLSTPGVTLEAPAGVVTGGYNWTLPPSQVDAGAAEPGIIDNLSGQLGYLYPDDATVTIVDGGPPLNQQVLKVPTGGINSSQIATGGVATSNIAQGAVTNSKLAASNYGLSTAGTGNGVSLTTTFAAPGALSSVTLTTGATLRAIHLMAVTDDSGDGGGGFWALANTDTLLAEISYTGGGGGTLGLVQLGAASAPIATEDFPPNIVDTVWVPPTPSTAYTFTLKAKCVSTGSNCIVNQIKLVAVEM